jgi:hypothetical protein
MNDKQTELTRVERETVKLFTETVNDASDGFISTICNSTGASKDMVAFIMIRLALKYIKDVDAVEALAREVSSHRWAIIENMKKGEG